MLSRSIFMFIPNHPYILDHLPAQLLNGQTHRDLSAPWRRFWTYGSTAMKPFALSVRLQQFDGHEVDWISLQIFKVFLWMAKRGLIFDMEWLVSTTKCYQPSRKMEQPENIWVTNRPLSAVTAIPLVRRPHEFGWERSTRSALAEDIVEVAAQPWRVDEGDLSQISREIPCSTSRDDTRFVCLKIVYPIVPNGFADHYPY